MATAITIKDLQANDIISFNCYGNGAINNVVNGVYLGSYDGTIIRNPAIAAVNHANIYPAIPANLNIPNNYTLYPYIAIKLADDSIIEIGIPWIMVVSLTRLDRKQAVILLNDFDNSRLIELNELLDINGFLNHTITVS